MPTVSSVKGPQRELTRAASKFCSSALKEEPWCLSKMKEKGTVL